MENNKTKAFIINFFKLILVCIVWSLFCSNPTDNYIYVLFVEPFVLYLPLALVTIGVFLECLSAFFDESINKRISIFSKCITGIAILLSISMIMIFNVSKAKDVNKQKNIAAESKYQVENFAKTPEMIEDSSYHYEGSNFFAFSNSFAFHKDQGYICEEDRLFDLSISAYEFENITPLFHKKIQKYLIDRYIEGHFKYLGANAKKITGEMNEKKYTYCLYTRNDGNRKYSYFFIIVEDKEDISSLMIDTYYVDNYSIDVSSIIEKMCAD